MREDAHRSAMAALASLGRQAEALRAYERCRTVLRNELGVDPSLGTGALYEEILVGREAEPYLRARAPAAPLPLLGRRRELARLSAPSGECAVRVVLGEPGIGKTRLLEEAAASGTLGSIRAAKCFRLTSSVPYTVLDELAPELRDAERGEASGLAPEGGAARLAAAWYGLLRSQPQTIVIDDLQWADEPSLVVLGLVLRRRPPRLRVLAAARDGDLGPDTPAAQLIEMATVIGVLEELVLTPLTAAEVAAGGLTVVDWKRSGGLPLFLQHLLAGDGSDLASMILERVSEAGARASDLMRAAAVLDRPSSPHELASVAGYEDADATREALRRLEVAGLLAETRGLWRLKHDVLGEAVRGDLAPRSRVAWHRRALEVLTVAGESAAAELARHALAAGDHQAALGHSLTAGGEALAAHANREARDHYGRALEIIDTCAAGDRHCRDRRRAIVGQARSLIVLGRTGEAASLLERLEPTSGADEVERLLLIAECAWAAWKPSQAIAPARQALAVAQELDDDQVLERVHAFAANPHGSLGQFAEAMQHIGAATAVASKHGRRPPAKVLYRLALIQHQTGREGDALATLDRCREAAMAEHDERSLVFERLVSAWCLGALGRYGQALTALDDIASIGRGEEAVARARVPNTRAWLLADLGLVEMALEADEESLEIAPSHGGALIAEPQIHTLINLAWDHLQLGAPDRAEACLDEAEGLSAGAEYARFRYLNRLVWMRGLLALEAGDVVGALAAAESTAAMARLHDAPRYVVRAELLAGQALRRGQVDSLGEVRRRLQAAARLAEQHGFASLAEQAHRELAAATGSARHRREADRRRKQMMASLGGRLLNRVSLP